MTLPIYDVRMSDGDGLRQVTNAVRDMTARIQGTADHDLTDLGTVRARALVLKQAAETLELWAARAQEAELASAYRELQRREQAVKVSERNQ